MTLQLKELTLDQENVTENSIDGHALEITSLLVIFLYSYLCLLQTMSHIQF